jgi:hypothetical protein
MLYWGGKKPSRPAALGGGPASAGGAESGGFGVVAVIRARDVAALIAFIDSRQLVPHAWGRRPTTASASGWRDRGADRDRPGPISPGRTEPQALRIIKALGGMEAAIDALLERIPPAQAMRGDIAGVPDELLGIHPMIVEGEMLVAPASAATAA